LAPPRAASSSGLKGLCDGNIEIPRNRLHWRSPAALHAGSPHSRLICGGGRCGGLSRKRVIMPELVETSDFLRFRFITLNGPAARNKGMALFPRKIDRRYAMLSRQDNENIHLMFSDNVHFGNERTPLLKPAFPWELVQIGNCGSPIETEAGWLVLSHGVGPVRRYCIGAFLLDLKDPRKVIGRLRRPMIEPNAGEREGYVPNVVYSCGALLHRGRLTIPFGLADRATGFATALLTDVLAAME